MLFYVQMKWNYQGRVSQEQLWDLEASEGEHGLEGLRSGVVKGLYKVVSQHRVIAIVDVDSLDDLDRNSMGWLPMREYLDFEKVWALRGYEGFIEDVRKKFPPPSIPNAAGRAPPTDAGPVEIAKRWFDALSKGDGPMALACLADDVHWINNPGIPGLSDIIPWLGDYHGRDEVARTFVIWADLAKVLEFKLLETFIKGDEVVAVVHEVGLVKATNKKYDIEFIQRFRVAGGRIVEWKSYWDTAKAIAAFRGM